MKKQEQLNKKMEILLKLCNLKEDINYTQLDLRIIMELSHGEASASSSSLYIRFALKSKFIIKLRFNLYRRSSMSNEKWKVLVKEEIDRGIAGLPRTSENDPICSSILNLLKESSVPLSINDIKEKIPFASNTTIRSKIKFLIDNKKIVGIGTTKYKAYALYGRSSSFNLSEKSQLNTLKAAFISIARKLENGEDVRDVLIQTGKIVEEIQ